MTWLKAIENILGAGEGGVNTKSQIRMARVIREHSKYILYLEELLHWDKSPYTDGIRDNYLSPDAKDLINDTTAPSST